MPFYIGCCCGSGGSGSGTGFNPGCICPQPGSVSVSVANLDTDCSFDAACPYSGLQNSTTYTLNRCYYDTSGSGEEPAYCVSQYKLGTLSLCDILTLYSAGDACSVCANEDPGDPMHNCTVAFYQFIGTVDCGGGTGEVDIYMGMWLQIVENVNGGGAGVSTIDYLLDIYHVQVFTDFSPVVVVVRGSGYSTAGTDISTSCGAEPGSNCYLTGATGGNSVTATNIDEQADCPTTVNFVNDVSGGTCCNEDGVNPVTLTLTL